MGGVVERLQRVRDPEAPLLRTGQHTFATVLDDGTAATVDMRTRKKRSIGAGSRTAAGWCTKPNQYRYDRSYGDRPFRAGHDFISPCRLDGKQAGVPASFPENFGTRVGDVYAWVDVDGTHAVRTAD